MVVYANKITKTETDEHGDDVERAIPFLRAYTVFWRRSDREFRRITIMGARLRPSSPLQRSRHMRPAFFANTGTIHAGGDKGP